MTSYFQTYDRNTLKRTIDHPYGCVELPIGYDHTILHEFPRPLMIQASSMYHPDKHEIVKQTPCYIPKDMLVNNQVPDILIESAPGFQKDYNTNLLSNYQLDIELITYIDGTRLQNGEIELLKRQEKFMEQPEMNISGAVEAAEPLIKVKQEESRPRTLRQRMGKSVRKPPSQSIKGPAPIDELKPYQPQAPISPDDEKESDNFLDELKKAIDASSRRRSQLSE